MIEPFAKPATESAILKISVYTLLKVGLTSHYGQSLMLMFLFFVYAIQEARHIMDLFELDKDYVKSSVLGLATLFSVAIMGAIKKNNAAT